MKVTYLFAEKSGITKWNIHFEYRDESFVLKDVEFVDEAIDLEQEEYNCQFRFGKIYNFDGTLNEMLTNNMSVVLKSLMKDDDFINFFNEKTSILINDEMDPFEKLEALMSSEFHLDDFYENLDEKMKKSIDRSLHNLIKRYFNQNGWNLSMFEDEFDFEEALFAYWYEGSHEDGYSWVESIKFHDPFELQLEISDVLIQTAKNLLFEKGVEWFAGTDFDDMEMTI